MEAILCHYLDDMSLFLELMLLVFVDINEDN
jgi:hypothetical protein